MFEVGQEIEVNGEKTKVLGRVKYSGPVPEYSVRIDNNKCWLEPTDKGWKLWKEVNDERNPVVEIVRNSDPVTDLTNSTYENFHISSHGIAIASESIGNTWGVKVGGRVELWRGKNVTDNEWPLFIAERNDDGIIFFWAGQYVSVE